MWHSCSQKKKRKNKKRKNKKSKNLKNLKKQLKNPSCSAGFFLAKHSILFKEYNFLEEFYFISRS